MAIQHKELPIYGLQHHPESIGSPDGPGRWLENFVKSLQASWTVFGSRFVYAQNLSRASDNIEQF